MDQNREIIPFLYLKKARKLALKSALSSIENLVVVRDFSEITEPKTKLMVKALDSLKVKVKF